MTDLFAVVMIFGTPAAVVAMVLRYRLKKAELAAGARGADAARVAALEAETKALQKRIETLESIVVDNDALLTARAEGARGARALEALAQQSASAPASAPRR